MKSPNGILTMAEKLSFEDRSDFLVAAAGSNFGNLQHPEAIVAIAESWLQIETSDDANGSADVAAELDAKRAINQGSRLAAQL